MSDANAKPMPKKDTLVDKMQNVLAPIGAKLGVEHPLQHDHGHDRHLCRLGYLLQAWYHL